MSELTSVVREASENGTDLSPDDIGTIEEMPEDTILSRQTSVNLVPFIGQRFVSQDAAYEFYCSFAKQCGFSIRRHRTRGKDGVGRGITRRDFTCHRGGYSQLKPSEDGKLQRNRKSSRCGCQAYMRIVKRTDFDVPEWRITGFSNIHNHELLKSNEVQLLPAYCTISADDKSRICMFAKAGMSVRQMLRLMELEKGVKLESVETEERLDVAYDQIATVLSHIKEFRGPSHGANDMSYNSPSDSLILPEVEDSDGIVQSFTSGNLHESLTLGKLKERRSRDHVDMYRKRRRCSVPCYGQFGHEATDCPMMGGDDMNGDGLGFL
ncbi:FAR1-related sequence 11 [Actinidia rufa]|uniref:FAR1-related sequence 11 n=1 Tax=Actinidia rufa TaxID=165716 RepID=A0A7J0H8S7_9ERIC|nr:FAR1-related sequence 11 [Actinidia rufa]